MANSDLRPLSWLCTLVAQRSRQGPAQSNRQWIFITRVWKQP